MAAPFSSPTWGRWPEGPEGESARRARHVPLRLVEFILRPRFAQTGGLGTPVTLGGKQVLSITSSALRVAHAPLGLRALEYCILGQSTETCTLTTLAT